MLRRMSNVPPPDVVPEPVPAVAGSREYTGTVSVKASAAEPGGAAAIAW